MIVTDDLGRKLTLAKPPRRIVTLTPSCTEDLFAIGAGRLVVGVTTADDYPPEVTRLPRIGDFYEPVTERIRALQPDLIFVESETIHRADVDTLAAKFAAPVYTQSAHRYADIPRQLIQLGQITGHEREAQSAARRMTGIAAQVSKRTTRRKPPTVLVLIDPTALYAAGPGSVIDDLIHLANGVNIVRGTNPYPRISKETLLAANPTYILVASSPEPGQTQPHPPKPIDAALADLDAVRNRRCLSINADHISRPTPRLADGLMEIARLLG